MAFDQETDDDPISQEHRSQVSWLRSMGDRAALFQMMTDSTETTQGLEAAEALAELADVRGLDHLISTLDSPSSQLRHEAAQILKRLNHPRGLRALRDHHDDSGDLASPHVSATTRAARREQLYGDLNQRSTDALVSIWHQEDRAKWSDLAFEVIGDILKERLGKLPARTGAGTGRTAEEIDDSVDPRVRALWMNGDMPSLTVMMEDEPDSALRLEAAEALADLGDEDALDLLIDALDDRDRDVREMAAQILDWLDEPRGNQALEDRGLEFETDADNLLGGTEAPPPQVPARPESWAADRPVARIPQAPPLSSASTSVWQQQEAAPLASLGMFLIGAAGGLLGFVLFRFGLELLGLQPLPKDAASWLEAPSLYYLISSILAGAVFGSIGGRVAQAVGRRLGREPIEGDLLPIMGALVEGATMALILNIALYAALGG